MKPVIAQRKMHRKPLPGLCRGFDKSRYRERNIIECCFGWIKELRRVRARYDKLASSFRAMVCLPCIDCFRREDFPDISFCLFGRVVRKPATLPELAFFLSFLIFKKQMSKHIFYLYCCGCENFFGPALRC
ncbi:transposase [Halomonas alkalisoli]|uniref:transposase n=1 Tax=Halomonas alkalisoli TaxID=2907158 RepID=UPI0034E27D78